MAELVKIEGTELAIREYNGQRVVTFKDIDTVHQRPSGTARKTFNRNRSRFEADKHYFMLQLGTENANVRLTDIRNIVVPSRGITVLTERGYLMLVKAFTDDLSWKVQDELISGYFKAKAQPQTAIEPVQIEDTKYNTSNTPVPKVKSWYIRNRNALEWVAQQMNCTFSYVCHKLLKRLGDEYDLNVAKKIYEIEVGYPPKYPLDIVDYFPQLSAMASWWLKDLSDWIENNNKSN